MDAFRRHWTWIFLWLAAPAYAQNTTNKGTEFWVTFPSHINVEDGEFYPPGLALYITSDIAASGTVSIPATGFTRRFTVSPNTITTVDVPRELSYTGDSETVEAKGILVSSDNDVVVYSHIYGEKRSGATLVMPSRSLGQEYFALTYSNTSQFTVIGTEEDTWVEITPTSFTEGGRQPNTPFTVQLQKGEVYQVRSGGDLTGTKITTRIPQNATCKKIAVYSGSKGVLVGCGGQGYDNLYQQLFASSSWGHNYIAVPMAGRPYDIIRILSGEDTRITINGAEHFLEGGRFLELPHVTTPQVIRSEQPVCVAQFSPSQTCDPRNPFDDRSPFFRPPYPGDPDMIILSPIEQNLREITLYSARAQDITDNYINVIIDREAAASFRLDGSQQTAAFESIPGEENYVYGRFRVQAGTHRLNAEGGFNAIAYGFGNYESYAYLAGTNLLDLSKRISHEVGPQIFSGTEGCQGRTVHFSADLDFEVYSYQWIFGDGNESEVMSDASGLQQTEHTYASAGSYAVILRILKSDGSECGDAEALDIEYELEVEPPPSPVPDFRMPASCVNDLIRFENLSAMPDGTEMNYLWDFGDGSAPLSGHTPEHRFPAPGVYLVSLSATSRYGCTMTVTREVIVNAGDPAAAFSFTDNICQKDTARFFDESTVSFGDIITWEWDFNGEGSSTQQHPEFQFATPGTKTIRLRAFSGASCYAIFEQTLTVLPEPEPEFFLPPEQASVCLNSPAFVIGGFSPLAGEAGQGVLTASGGLDEQGRFHPALAGPGSHEVFYSFTNNEGCTQTVSQVIQVLELPQVNAGKDRKILEGQSVQLEAQSNGIRFEWSPATGLSDPFALKPLATPDSSTTYTLRAENESGCESFSQVRVEVLKVLRVPNAFSPNSDGVNDQWLIQYIEDYPQATVTVFNRYGERVFFSRGYSMPWDGKYDNTPLPAGTYYYVIEPDPVHPPLSGSLSIVP